MIRVSLLVLISITALAQSSSGSIRGPLSGYVGDTPTQSIRPIVGVPGGAYLGAAVMSGFEKAWVAPGGMRAVVLRQGQYFLISGLAEDTVRMEDRPLDFEGTDASIAWSVDGKGMVIANAGRAQTAEWLDGSKAWEFRPAQAIPEGTITALAIDAGSGALAMAVLSNSAVMVHARKRWSDNLELLYQGQAVNALVYTRSGDILYVADNAAGQILPFPREQAGTAGAITSDPEAYRDVIALAVLSDDIVCSVHSKRRVLTMHSLRDRTVRTVQVEGTPQGIVSIPGGDLYVLAAREKATDAVLVFDAASGEIYFIPGGGAQ